MTICLRCLFFVAIIAGCVFVAAGQTSPRDAGARVLGAEAFELSKEAADAGISGKLVLKVKIDDTGKLEDVEVLAGPVWPCGKDLKEELSNLRQAVKDNLSKAKFSPEIQNGKAYSSEVLMDFNLNRNFKNSEPDKWGDPYATAVEGGVVNGKAIKLARPSFPDAARAHGIYGFVKIQVLIGETGEVIRAGPLAGPSVFAKSARSAACSSKFSPTLLTGKPVKVSGIITYNFMPKGWAR